MPFWFLCLRVPSRYPCWLVRQKTSWRQLKRNQKMTMWSERSNLRFYGGQSLLWAKQLCTSPFWFLYFTAVLLQFGREFKHFDGSVTTTEGWPNCARALVSPTSHPCAQVEVHSPQPIVICSFLPRIADPFDPREEERRKLHGVFYSLFLSLAGTPT